MFFYSTLVLGMMLPGLCFVSCFIVSLLLIKSPISAFIFSILGTLTFKIGGWVEAHFQKMKNRRYIKTYPSFIKDGGKRIDFDALYPKYKCFFCDDWFHLPYKRCKCELEIKSK